MISTWVLIMCSVMGSVMKLYHTVVASSLASSMNHHPKTLVASIGYAQMGSVMGSVMTGYDGLYGWLQDGISIVALCFMSSIMASMVGSVGGALLRALMWCSIMGSKLYSMGSTMGFLCYGPYYGLCCELGFYYGLYYALCGGLYYGL